MWSGGRIDHPVMNVLLINTVCDCGSTGRICSELADRFSARGDTVILAYGRAGGLSAKDVARSVRIGTDTDVLLHGLTSRLLDRQGLGSVRATKAFLAWADAYDPGLLWLHNLHGYYLNYELLFRWIRQRPQMEVRWTLHDCWPFTGHCAYYTAAGCEQWKIGCHHCPQKNRYPASLLADNSADNYRRKRAAFTEQLRHYKDDGFERINPSILKADIQAAYPDYSERAIGFKRFSDVLRQMEKEKLLTLEMDEQNNMLVKML